MSPTELSELDRMLATGVMKWRLHTYDYTHGKYQGGNYWKDSVGALMFEADWHWHPSTDIAQAFMVAEKIGMHLELVRSEVGTWKCTITSFPEGVRRV